MRANPTTVSRMRTKCKCGYSFCLLLLLALYSTLIQLPNLREIFSRKHGNITHVIGTTLHKSKELLESRYGEFQSWSKELINGETNSHVTRYEPIKCGVKSKPHRSIFYVRTHRAASTTLRNMLLIYGREYNLTICMDVLDLHRANWPYGVDVSRLTKTSNERCQLVAEEIMYSSKLVDKIMAEKVFTLTSVRHPVQHFISLFRQMKIQEVVQRVTSRKGLTENQAMEIFLKDWEDFQRAYATDENIGIGEKLHLGMIRLNLQSFSLGITDVMSLEDVVHRLNEMNLIVVFERFDESMVILREKLCCSLDDVAYRKLQNHETSSTVYVPEELQRLIINFNKIDAIFYQHAVKRLDEEMSAFDNFEQLLGIYRAELKKFEAKCTDPNFPAQFRNKICPPVEGDQVETFVNDVRKEQKLILLDKLRRRFSKKHLHS